jgi:hypothetical protein
MGSTLFSDSSFLRAFMESGVSDYELRALPISQKDATFHVLGERRSFGLRRFELGPCGLYVHPPVGNGEMERTVREILNSLRKAHTLSFTWNVRFDDKELEECLRQHNLSETQTTTHVLRLLADYPSTFSKFNATIRNQIRRAERDGVTVRRATTPELVSAYHQLHLELVEEKGAFNIVYPEKLFQELVRLEQDVWLLLAEFQGQVIGGAVFLRDGDSLLYWHSSARRAFSKQFPACALLNRAIQLGHELNLRTVNFGASAGKPSLEQFKSFWAAEPQTCYRFSWTNRFWKFTHRLTRKIYAG